MWPIIPERMLFQHRSSKGDGTISRAITPKKSPSGTAGHEIITLAYCTSSQFQLTYTHSTHILALCKRHAPHRSQRGPARLGHVYCSVNKHTFILLEKRQVVVWLSLVLDSFVF